MKRSLKAFEVDVNGKPFDYRIGGDVNLDTVRKFFGSTYGIKKLWNGGRHVLGILTNGDDKLFLKLSTTIGISELTKNEYAWNELFNKQISPASPFAVPENIEQGYFTDEQYYFIARLFTGIPLASLSESSSISPELIRSTTDLINFSEVISVLRVDDLTDHRTVFLTKVRAWYEAVPEGVRDTYHVSDLWSQVESGTGILDKKCRHGDFTPWHMIRLDNGKLGLLDGEHFLRGGVEYYDMCYFIQRVFTVLEAPDTAKRVLHTLLERGYDKEKLRVVLASRAIGGYLDASLAFASDLSSEMAFQAWVLSL